MKLSKFVPAVLSLLAAAVLFTIAAPAQSTGSKRSILTFSQPFEVPGKVLAAGTYVFRLQDSETNRHIVQIFSADGRQLIWSCLAINDNRLTATNQTVMMFGETAAGQPQPLKVWFYPGDNWGQEFVYPKRRAVEIAAAVAAPVPAMPDDVMPAQLPVERIAAIPVETVMPAATAVAAPASAPAPVVVAANAEPTASAATEAPAALPHTAGETPLLALLGLLSLSLAWALRRRVAVRV